MAQHELSNKEIIVRLLKSDLSDYDNLLSLLGMANEVIREDKELSRKLANKVRSVTSPVNKLVTNKTTVTVAGTTNDATSSPVTLTINGSAVTVYDDVTFSKDITLKDGSNTITVVAKDGAGRTTTVTRTVTLDTKAPVISDVSLAPNPADVGATYVISVSVTD